MEEEARAINLVERSRADLKADGSGGGHAPSLGDCLQIRSGVAAHQLKFSPAMMPEK
jgi:hypothetical protein